MDPLRINAIKGNKSQCCVVDMRVEIIQTEITMEVISKGLIRVICKRDFFEIVYSFSPHFFPLGFTRSTHTCITFTSINGYARLSHLLTNIDKF